MELEKQEVFESHREPRRPFRLSQAAKADSLI